MFSALVKAIVEPLNSLVKHFHASMSKTDKEKKKGKKNIPYPFPIVKDLLQLRGGPAWRGREYEIYLLPKFRPKMKHKSRTEKAYCDNETDGGGWILIWSYEIPAIYRASASRQIKPSKWQKEMLDDAGFHRCYPVVRKGKTDKDAVKLSYLKHPPKEPLTDGSSGHLYIRDLLEGIEPSMDLSDEEILDLVSDIRMFSCRMGSRPFTTRDLEIAHVKTSDDEVKRFFLKKLETSEKAQQNLNAFQNSFLFTPLDRHSLDMEKHRSVFPCFWKSHDDKNALVENLMHADENRKAGLYRTSILQVWVRFKPDVVTSTDGDIVPNYERSGPATIEDECEKPVGRARGGSLQIMHQPSFDESIVENMSMEKDLAENLQTMFIDENFPSGKQGPCVFCDGTGLQSYARKNNYGTRTAKQIVVRVRFDVTELGSGEKLGLIFKKYGNSIMISRIISESIAAKKIPHLFPGDILQSVNNKQVDLDSNVEELIAKSKLPLQLVLLRMGTDIKDEETRLLPYELSSQYSEEKQSLNERLDPKDLKIKVHPVAISPSPMPSPRQKGRLQDLKIRKCWVCMGSGKANAMLGSLDFATSKRMDDFDDEDDDDLCEICYCETKKYGISDECTHFFCEECIQRTLSTALKMGHFPCYCPICKTLAPKGKMPSHGYIGGKALSFLQKRSVITKELQFRFMREQTKNEELFFQCPGKCGNFLLDVDPTLVRGNDGKIKVKIERCVCGVGVCVQCHALVPDKEMTTHKCPQAKKSKLQEDLETQSLMAKMGKKCPKCSMFVMKNGGCDYMMCGTVAHGSLKSAIRNGGCGHSFHWQTLKPAPTFFINIEGKRVTGDPAAMYPKEILELKKKYNIEMTDEDKLRLKALEKADKTLRGLGKDPKGLRAINGSDVNYACFNNDLNELFDQKRR
eukprot:g748.t1